MSLRSPALALRPPNPLPKVGESGLGRLVSHGHLGVFLRLSRCRFPCPLLKGNCGADGRDPEPASGAVAPSRFGVPPRPSSPNARRWCARLVTSAGVCISGFALSPAFLSGGPCGDPRPASAVGVGPPPLPLPPRSRVGRFSPSKRSRHSLCSGFGRDAPSGERCPACGGGRFARPASAWLPLVAMLLRVGRSLWSLSPAPAAVGAFVCSLRSRFRLPAAARSRLCGRNSCAPARYARRGTAVASLVPLRFRRQAPQPRGCPSVRARVVRPFGACPPALRLGCVSPWVVVPVSLCSTSATLVVTFGVGLRRLHQVGFGRTVGAPFLGSATIIYLPLCLLGRAPQTPKRELRPPLRG